MTSLPSAIGFTEIELPEPQFDPIAPILPDALYAHRLETLRERMERRNLDLLVIYADQDRFANLAYLTGYEPRFEKTLLIVARQGKPLLLIGSEGRAGRYVARRDVDVVLCPTLSIRGRPRVSRPSLLRLFRESGVRFGRRVGLVGAKYFLPGEVADAAHTSDAPGFIVDTLRDLVGPGNLTNETGLFIHPESGLRTCLSLHDIALFERAAEVCYASVRRLLLDLRSGMTEVEATSLLGYNVWDDGTPRTDVSSAGETELAAVARGYLDALAIPYFRCIKAWYEALRIGATCGEVYGEVRWFVESGQMGAALNPGHIVHPDEWPNTPFFPGSPHRLGTGHCLQCDITAVPGAPFCGIHAEDKLVLADEDLRRRLQAEYPTVWTRIERRRSLLRDTLGIRVSEEVLPLSSIQAWICPFLLPPRGVLTAA